jgi:hypothetical protein
VNHSPTFHLSPYFAYPPFSYKKVNRKDLTMRFIQFKDYRFLIQFLINFSNVVDNIHNIVYTRDCKVGLIYKGR